MNENVPHCRQLGSVLRPNLFFCTQLLGLLTLCTVRLKESFVILTNVSCFTRTSTVQMQGTDFSLLVYGEWTGGGSPDIPDRARHKHCSTFSK